MTRFKKKINWKGIICAVLVVALVAGGCGALVSFTKNDRKTISSTSFIRGDVDDNGLYTPSDKTLVNEEVFSCIGLRVEPDFDSDLTYDVYYYDHDLRFVESVKNCSGVYDEDFPLARFCRIVIHPNIPEDVDEDDFKIKFYEIFKYTSKLKITVDKDQKYVYGDCPNLYNDSEAMYGKTISADVSVGSNYVIEEQEGQKLFEISVDESFDYIDVFVRVKENSHSGAKVLVITSNDSIVKSVHYLNAEDMAAGEWCKLTIEIPQDVEENVDLVVRIQQTAECYIFGY